MNRIRWVRSGTLVHADILVSELGGNFPELARTAGMDPNILADPDAPMLAQMFARFLNVAANTLDCPSFALQLGARQGLYLLGPLAPLMASATTVREFVTDVIDFFPLVTQGAVVGAGRDADCVWLTYELSADIYSSNKPAVECAFALLVTEVRRHAPGWQPQEVRFRHRRPDDLTWYHRLFGSNVIFDADRNAFALNHEILAHATRGGNAPLRGQLHGYYRQLMLEQPTYIVDRTERLVRATLPAQHLSLATIASSMGLSDRTLQRRLAEAHTSLSEITDAVRADLAISFLRDSSLGVGQIAEILQFSETSALSRAVRRWHGASPHAIRREARPQSRDQTAIGNGAEALLDGSMRTFA